jgi:alpha-L-fucosidase
MKMLKIVSFVAVLTVLALSSVSQAAPVRDFTNESPGQRAQRMEWFNEARFGMFIHWGVYSVPAGEWEGKTNYGEWFMEETKMPVSQYEKFAQQFNPVKFDAKAWVRMAKDAGMKYIVITSKHHDGFGMWRSDLTDWCIKSTPFQRDPLAELAAECKKAGITFCTYHSIMDWHHPDYSERRKWNDKATGEPNMDRYVDFMKGQLKELITGYGPLGILWFDGEWEKPWTHERGVDLYNYVRSLQPNIIVNNRVGKGRAGMGGMDKGKGVGDYGTPEQEIPPTGFGPGVAWESCMTMNGHWGYNKHDQNWKSAEVLVRNLIDCASKGGNYLLNVGPTSEGLIPGPSVERLAAMGRWMKVNREAIYGTEASPFNRLTWGRCTKKVSGKTTTLYLHVFNWPADGRLVVPGLKNPVQKAWLLADSKKKSLATSQTGKGAIVSVPKSAPDAIASTVVLKVKGVLEVEPAGLGQDYDGSIHLPAADAKLHGDGIKFDDPAKREAIRFSANAEGGAEWKFEVTAPGKFEVVAEVSGRKKVSIEARVGENRLRGETPTTKDDTRFKPAKLGTLEISTARKVTLSVHAVKDGWHPISLQAVKLELVK